MPSRLSPEKMGSQDAYAQIGLSYVLLTWDRDLSIHPHLHVVARAAGSIRPSLAGSPHPSISLFPLRPYRDTCERSSAMPRKEALEDEDLFFPDVISHLKSPRDFLRFLTKRGHLIPLIPVTAGIDLPRTGGAFRQPQTVSSRHFAMLSHCRDIVRSPRDES